MILSLAFSSSSISTSFLPARAANRGRLVDEVGQVRPGEPRGTPCDDAGFHILAHRHLAHVDLDDLFAPADVGEADHHLAVEPARPQERRVEHVRPVGGGDDDDAVVGLETVHLDEQLVQRLLALVVAAAEPRPAVPAHRIDLVDEDDARRLLLRLVEHVTHPGDAPTPTNISTKSEPEMEKNGTLASPAMALASSVLPVPGLAHHQYAPRDASAETLETPRITQEFDQFLDVFLRLVDARHIGERGLDLVFGEQPRLALAEGHRPAAPPRRRPASGA